MTSTATQPLNNDLQRRVKNFLWQSQMRVLKNVEVETKDGVVTLRGVLPSYHSRQMCLSFCQRVAGVVRIIDQIEVDWQE